MLGLLVMLGVWAAVVKLGIQVVTWDRIYRYAELIAVSGIAAFFLLLCLPMTGPFDFIIITGWWKWLYSAIVAAVGSVLATWAVLCAVIVWPLCFLTSCSRTMCFLRTRRC